jgi:hypothetical protein
LVWQESQRVRRRLWPPILRSSGVLDTFDNQRWIGDKGYVGLGMLTPHRKPAGRDLTDQEKAHNRVINSVRAVVDRVIANFKTWRIVRSYSFLKEWGRVKCGGRTVCDRFFWVSGVGADKRR